MKLPIPNLHKKEKQEYYLALLLRDEKIVAVILGETDGALKIIGRQEAFLDASIDTIDHEVLLEVLDKTISKAEETLPPNVETEKTVFGVKDSWVEDKKIKKEYLARLKKVCDALTLSPIGFMVISEAIAHLLQKEEGAPLSGIVAEIGKTHVTLSLFRAGKVLETFTGTITDSVPQTVDRLLHHFTVDVLPSRIILFNGGDDDELAQEFLAHHWSKSLPFLHIPQISVLPKGFDGKAMIYGAAEQMGFEIFGSLGEVKVKELRSPKGEEKTATKEPEGQEETTEKKKTDAEEANEAKDGPDEEGQEDKLVQAENFGFVVGEDITAVPHAAKTPAKATSHEADGEHHLPKHPGFGLDHPTHATQEPENDEEADEHESRPGRRDKQSNFLSALPIGALTESVGAFFAKLPLKGLKLPGVRPGKTMIIAPLILVLLVGLILLYIFGVKAAVTLQMEPKHIDDQQAITLSPNGSTDFAQKILIAREIDASLDGSVSTEATGKKEVGDKAKGTVTLYNNNQGAKSVPAGTVITSSNDLDFTTDKDVTVASASGDVFSGTKPGTVQVSVTAKDIGTEYNLPSNTKFTVSASPSLAAKNDSAFSGGTKKNVTVVSKADTDKLLADLPKSLEAKAKDAFKDKVSSGETILPVFTDEELSKKDFDKDVGDQASKVTLKATVTFTTLAYKNNDIKQLAEALLKDKYSQDLAISDKGVNTTITNVKTDKDGDVSATLTMIAGLLPKVDTSALLQQLPGKSFTDANELIKQSVPQVKDTEIKLSPNIPFLPKILPRIKTNITISVATNG
jgi:hypothetical protein